MKCSECAYIRVESGQPYHDCRKGPPSVVVSGFKPNPNPGAEGSTIGKIMTVWPRVSLNETGCGAFKQREL